MALSGLSGFIVSMMTRNLTKQSVKKLFNTVNNKIPWAHGQSFINPVKSTSTAVSTIPYEMSFIKVYEAARDYNLSLSEARYTILTHSGGLQQNKKLKIQDFKSQS